MAWQLLVVRPYSLDASLFVCLFVFLPEERDFWQNEVKDTTLKYVY